MEEKSPAEQDNANCQGCCSAWSFPERMMMEATIREESLLFHFKEGLDIQTFGPQTNGCPDPKQVRYNRV